MPKKVIKVKYEDMMTRVEVFTSNDKKPFLSFYDLKSKISDRFKLKEVADELSLRYTDEDGDVIVLLDGEGYWEAFRQSLNPIYVEASLRSKGSSLKSESRFHNLGPFGGGAGFDWDDGSFEGINGISVTTSSECLIAIQVTYADGKNNSHIATQHGGAGEAIHMKFQYPNERLQKMSGYCGPVENTWQVIKSLSFETNVAKYGPFGVLDGVPFVFDLRSRNAVGFYGRAGNRYLISIGLHTQNEK